MHNNKMAAGSRDRPPMLATGRYAQWRSRFLRYINTRPNGDALRKCILKGPYTPTIVTTPAIPATEDSLAVPEQTTVETVTNMTPENKAHFDQKRTFIDIDGIGDEILLNFNEIRAERIAKNANPLALVATAQPYQDPYYQAPKSHKSYAPTSKASIPTRSHATTRHKGKETAKPITPPSESVLKEDSDPEQAQKDKEMQKNLALIAKYFKKLYKPTNNNLRTSSNTRNKNVDTTLRYKNDNQTGQFRNQRTMTVAGARETIGSPVVKQSGIQCFNCKEFGHFAKECRKQKKVKDSMYHKEKMLLCKQAEKGVPLQAVQYDWLVDTDEEIDEQELEAQYSYMAKIQKVPTADSGIDSKPFNVILASPDMCDNDIQNDQNDVECDDERVAHAYLIANLKLDVDENKKIQKQLKKANTTLAHELTECKSILAEISRTLEESNSMYRIETRTTQTRASQLPHTSRNTNPRVSTSTRVNHRTNVSRPQLKSNKMKEKIVPNTSQVKFLKTEVEEHHSISSISNQSKSVNVCNDSLKSRTSNVNVVCATCGKCVFNLNHDACVSKYLNDVNARTKKPKVVPISTRKPKSQANKSVATPRKKTVESESTV
ncbi:reverse transcriptase domain-containing protein [Tanacetum coccineum]